MASGSSSLQSERLERILEASERADDDGLTKQEKLQRLILKKKKCDSRAQEIVLKFIEVGVTKDELFTHAVFVSPNHWEDIVEERKLSKICGWVLCDNELGQIPKQQYSIRRNTVLDITLRKSFCSGHCYAASEHFKNQLPVSPLWLRDEEPTPEFEILQDTSKELHGISVNLNVLSLNDVDGSQVEEDEHRKSSTDDDDYEDDDNNKSTPDDNDKSDKKTKPILKSILKKS